MSLLPDAPTDPVIDPLEFKWLIHSPPKIGKTSLANEFESPLIVKFEDGTKGLRCFSTPAGRGRIVENWVELGEITDEIVEEGKGKYSTLVIDTIEGAYARLYAAIAETQGVEFIDDIEKWARGYREANVRMKAWLDVITNAGFCVVLLSHSRYDRSTKGTVERTVTVPDLSNSPRSVVMAWADIILCLEIRDERDDDGELHEVRTILAQPTSSVEAGGRVRYMPPRIPLSPSPREGYTNLMEAFKDAVTVQLEELGVTGNKQKAKRKTAKRKGK